MYLYYPSGDGTVEMITDTTTEIMTSSMSPISVRFQGDTTTTTANLLSNQTFSGGLEPNTSAVQDAGSASDLQVAFFTLCFNVYVNGILCGFGYFGNILTIIVLQKDKVRTSNTIFLQALAVFDTMFLCYVMLCVVLRSIPKYTGYLTGYAEIEAYIVAIVLPLGWTSQTCTIWIVMVIAIDRYLVVSRPLKAQLWCTKHNARWVVVGVFTAAVLFNVPRWPHFYFVAFNTEDQASTVFVSHIAHQSMFWDETLYKTIYHQILGFVCLFVIPLTVIITLNILLVLTIKKAVQARQAMTNSFKNSNKPQQSESNLNLNIMLSIMITIFVVCELPDFIASIIGASNTKVDEVTYAYYAPIKECLLVMNSTVNFYIYCIFYKRFRATLASMLGCGQDTDATPASRRSGGMTFANGHRGRSMSDVRSVGSQQTLNSSLSGSTPHLSTSLSNISLSPSPTSSNAHSSEVSLSVFVASENAKTKL